LQAVAIAGFGIVSIDGGAKSQPAFKKVYEPASKDDCCMPTALEIVTTRTAGTTAKTSTGEATLVVSIPNGKMNGAWCQCFGSKLAGVALPN
jgi:hypothetical protein